MNVDIVDPPSPFAPADEWRAFLAEMRAAPRGDQVDHMTRLAEAVVEAWSAGGAKAAAEAYATIGEIA